MTLRSLLQALTLMKISHDMSITEQIKPFHMDRSFLLDHLH